MLWLAGKFTALEIIKTGVLPALVAWAIPQYLMSRKIKVYEEAEKEHPDFDIVDEEKLNPYWPVVFIGILSFIFPLAANLIGLPPFLGLLAGVGILWIYIDIKAKNGDNLHENGQIVKIIQKVDLSTLKFFIGILLAVGASSYIGLLEKFSDSVFGAVPSLDRLIFGSVALGLISSILDNVPLVAAAIKMLGDNVFTSIWVLLALTAGTGGSILIIGSAAGVAAMGQVKELSFGYYLKKAAFPALLGYGGGILIWLIFNYISHLPRPFAAGNILRGFAGGYPPARVSVLWYNRGICQVIP